MKKITLLFLLLSPFFVKATNYTSIANGNWSSSSTWSPAGVPGSGDDVTIANTVTLDTNESVNNITINSSKTFTVSGSNSLTVYGNFTNNGTYTASTGAVTFAGSSNETIGGSAAITFYDITANPSSSTDTIFLGHAITINDNFAISNGVFYCKTYQITGNATGTMTMAANTTLGLGLVTSGTAVGFPPNYTTANITLDASSTIVYQANYPKWGQGISSVPNYGNLTIFSPIASTVAAPRYLWVVRGNLTIGPNVAFTQNVGTDSIKGNITIGSGATFNSYASNTYFEGSSFTNNGFYKEYGAYFWFKGSTNQVLSSSLHSVNTIFNSPRFYTQGSNDTVFIEGGFSTISSSAIAIGAGCTVIVPAAYNDSIVVTAGFANYGTFTALNGVVYCNGAYGGGTAVQGNSPVFYKLTTACSTFRPDHCNVYVTSDYTIKAGVYDPIHATTYVGGDLINNSGAATNYGQIIMNGSHNQTIRGTTPISIEALVINTSSLTDTVKLANNFTVRDWGFYINQGTFDVSSSNDSLTVGASFNNNGNFVARHGTVTMNGSSAETIGGTSVTSFCNLTISNSSTVTLGNNINVNSNLSITAGILDSYTYQITGNSTGTLSMSSGAGLRLGSGSSATNVFFPYKYTTSHISLDPNSNVSYHANTNQTVSDTAIYGNLQLTTGASATTKTTSGDSLTVKGTLTIYSNTTLNGLSSGVLTIGGDFTNNGTYTVGSSTVTMNGSSSQTIGGSSHINFYDLNVAGTGTVYPSYNLTINKNLNISSGTLDVTSNNYNLTIGGNFTDNGILTLHNNTVTMNGSSNQNINGGNTPTFYNFTENQAASTDTVFLNAPVTVSNTLTTTQGILDCQMHQLTNSATPAVGLSPSSATICSGNPTTLTASNYNTYIWTPATGLNATTGATVSASPTATTTYTVYGSSGHTYTCGTGTDAVSVNPTPTVSITSKQNVLTVVNPDTLIAVGASSYIWSNGDTSSLISVSPSGQAMYRVIGTNNYGCSSNDSIIIRQLVSNLSLAYGDTNLYQLAKYFDSTYTPGPSDTLEDGPLSQFQRFYAYWLPRLSPNGSFSSYAKAYAQYSQNAHQNYRGSTNIGSCEGNSPVSGTWTELGPAKNNLNNCGYTTWECDGRADAVAVDPNNGANNTQIMYAGGADGGVFQSTDMGNSWVNMGTDRQFLSLGISDIVVEPTNSNIVYVATGDPDDGFSFSDGIYETTNANLGQNATWSDTGPWNLNNYSDLQSIYKIVLDPNDNTMIYAATDNGIFFSNQRNGSSPISTWYPDMGSQFPTFSLVTATISGNKTAFYSAGYDIEYGTGTENPPNTGGVNWTSITGPGTGLDLSQTISPTGHPHYLTALPFNNGTYGQYLSKIFLAISPNGQYLYANIFTNYEYPGTHGTYLQWVARYNIPNQHWDIVPTSVLNNFGSSSNPIWAMVPASTYQLYYYGTYGYAGPYHKDIIVDPNDPTGNTILVGTTDINVSTNGGQSFQDLGYGAPGITHPDIHTIVPSSTSSNLFYVANDGGISSLDASNGFSSATAQELNNGLDIGLAWDAESSEQNPETIISGNWDNGLDYTMKNNGWNNSVVEDDDNIMINYLDDNYIYHTEPESKFYGLYKINTSGSSFCGDGIQIDSPVTLVGCDASAPRFLDPINPNIFYEGRVEIYKGITNSNSSTNYNINALSDFSENNQTIFKDYTKTNIVYGTRAVECMDICPTNPNYIIAGMVPVPDVYTTTPTTTSDYFRLTMTLDGAAGGQNDWEDITPDPTNYFISGVAMSYIEPAPNQINTSHPFRVWITYSGLNTGKMQFGSNTIYHKLKEGVSYDGINFTWSDYDQGLCDFNINCIVYEDGSNDGLYIGTDAGVYYRNASMSSWEPLGANFPNVVVEHLKINYCSRTLIAPTWGRGTWEIPLVPSASIPLEITSNTTWSAPSGYTSMFMPTDVEVTPGNTLTIPTGLTVNMSENRKIIVDPGATLIVNGTITNDCDLLWAGIDLQGTSSQPQSNLAVQGQVIINGGTIENALNGITTIKTNPDGSWNWAYTGGIIKATNATFIDCKRAVQYLYYHDPSNPMKNVGFFNSCNFTIDDNYTGSGSSPSLITMYEVHGVTFKDNTFQNISTQNNASVRGTGIGSIDASYNLLPLCHAIDGNTGKCIDGNTFKGLYYGVNASSTLGYNINIQDNNFTDNLFDIDLKGTDNSIVNSNTFTKSSNTLVCSYCIPYNMYIDQCTGYSINGNSFDASGYTPNTYGIIVNNSGPLNNLINNNTFTNLYVGIQAQGTNGNIELLPPNPPNPPKAIYSGLQFQCNQFTSSVSNGADIAVTSGLVDPAQGSSINSYTTADNIFNYSCSTVPRNNIAVNSGATGITYNAPNITSDIPTCITSGVTINTDLSVTTSSCGTGQPVNPSGWNTNYNVMQQSADSLDSILTAGDASSLYTEIQNGTPAQIQSTLLAAGPYLSDGVLIATIDKDLPSDTLRNIIIPNSPVDSIVMDSLNRIQLPGAIREEINAAQRGVSPREEVVYGKSYYQNQADYAFNGLLRYYLNDTTYTSNVDSALTIIQSQVKPSDAELAKIASLQAEFGDFTQSTTTLDSLTAKNDTNYSGIEQVLPIVMALQQDSNHFDALINNERYTQTLSTLASSSKPGYVNARVLLEFVDSTQFTQPIEPLDNGNGHRSIRNNQNTNNTNSLSGSFKLYPNPANNEVTIVSSTEDSTKSTELVLYDIMGKQVLTWNIPLSQTVITENISNLPIGFYMYCVIQNNKIIQRGKLIITR